MFALQCSTFTPSSVSEPRVAKQPPLPLLPFLTVMPRRVNVPAKSTKIVW